MRTGLSILAELFPRSIYIHFLHLCLKSVAISSSLLPQKHFAHDHNVWLILRNCKYYTSTCINNLTCPSSFTSPSSLAGGRATCQEIGLRGKLLNIMTEHLKGFEWHERGADLSFCKHRFSRGLDLQRDQPLQKTSGCITLQTRCSWVLLRHCSG